MNCLVIDTETAGLDGGVCDLAIVCLDNAFNVVWEVESLIDPERPISPTASGIHHITDDMVWDQPTLAEFMEIHEYPFNRGSIVLGGHNVRFDIRMLQAHIPQSYKRLDTLKLARNLYPSAPDHKLQTLRYLFKLEAGKDAHRAMGDVFTTIGLMKHIAADLNTDLQGLIEAAQQPLTLDAKMPFGKHKGFPLRDLPSSYVGWLLGLADLDPDIRDALESARK